MLSRTLIYWARLSSLTQSILFALTCAVFIWLLTPLLSSWQNPVNDQMMRWHQSDKFKSPITIVYLDQEDIRHLGGWPVPRNIYAYITNRLVQLGAKVIVFDMLWEDLPGPNDEDDYALAATLNRSQKVCGAFYFREHPIQAINEQFNDLLAAEWSCPSPKIAPGFPVYPDSLFLSNNEHFGFVHFYAESGNIRRTLTSAKLGRHQFASLELLAANLYTPAPIKCPPQVMWINYQLSREHLPLVSLRELASTESIRNLTGHIVLVGVISSQINFQRATPLSIQMPFIGIHAQIIDNLLNRTFLTPFSWLILGLVLLMVALVHILLLQKFPSGYLLIFLTLTLLSLIFYALIWPLHFIFPVVPVLLLLLILTSRPVLKSHLGLQEAYQRLNQDRDTLQSRFKQVAQELVTLKDTHQQLRETYQTELTRLRRELKAVDLRPDQEWQSPFKQIICAPDSPMLELLSELQRIAATEAPVLITGESGTGKELIANEIHHCSSRRQAAFLAINCSAISESLLESELFGHVKGAFTGAQQNKEGFFARAHGGTLFLDEISETSSSFQAKLLRVIQDGQFYPVGSSQLRRVNVRVIAASNRNLQESVRHGRFREDLFYRLNVLPIHLPPLRDRRQDIPYLISHFLENAQITISEEAMGILQNFSWPGNIRQLQNITQRLRLLPSGSVVQSEWLRQQLGLAENAPPKMDALEAEILLLFRRCQFSNDAPAKIAQQLRQMHRSTITEYLKGMTFQFMADNEYDIEAVIRCFNPQPSAEGDQRLRNRISRYLHNLTSDLPVQESANEWQAGLRAKLTKMPQKYHAFAVRLVRAYIDHKWMV